MDERDEIGAVEWLKSVADPAERARFAREFGWVNSSDLEMDRYLTGQCLQRAGEDGAILAAVRGAPDQTKAGKQFWKKVRGQLERAQRRKRWAARYLDVAAERRVDLSKSGNASVVSRTEQVERAMESDEPDAAIHRASVLAAAGHLARYRRPSPGSLTESIAIHVIGNASSIWPHVYGPWPAPAWYLEMKRERAAGAMLEPQAGGSSLGTLVGDGGQRGDRGSAVAHKKPNPFAMSVVTRPVFLRSADLTFDEFMKVYQATAFALDRGILWTSHITVLWAKYEVTDHEEISRLMGRLIERLTKWACKGKPGANKYRHRERSGYGTELAWAFCHENGHGRGFHTHILCNVAPEIKRALAAYLTKVLAELTGHTAHGDAVHVSVSSARTESERIDRHFNWMRYVTKGLPEEVLLQYRGEPAERPLREEMKLWAHRGAAPPVSCRVMARVSHNVGGSAQKRAGFVSKLEEGRGMLDRLFDGSEWRDGQGRRMMEEVLPTLSI